MRRIGVLGAVFFGMAVMSSCVPTAPAQLFEPGAGCYAASPPGNRGLSYSGVADTKDNSAMYKAMDKTCTGGIEVTATVVLAANVSDAKAKCRALQPRPGYDDTLVALVRDWGWDLGPNAWAC